jgi:hypothetical protein
MPVLKLIKFNLPSLHKATAFLDPMDYLSEYAPTLIQAMWASAGGQGGLGGGTDLLPIT